MKTLTKKLFAALIATVAFGGSQAFAFGGSYYSASSSYGYSNGYGGGSYHSSSYNSGGGYYGGGYNSGSYSQSSYSSSYSYAPQPRVKRARTVSLDVNDYYYLGY